MLGLSVLKGLNITLICQRPLLHFTPSVVKAGLPENCHGIVNLHWRTYPWLREEGGSVQGHPIQVLLLLRGFRPQAAAPAAAADGAAAAPAPSPALCSHKRRHQSLLSTADSLMASLTAGSITGEPEKH